MYDLADGISECTKTWHFEIPKSEIFCEDTFPVGRTNLFYAHSPCRFRQCSLALEYILPLQNPRTPPLPFTALYSVVAM